MLVSPISSVSRVVALDNHLGRTESTKLFSERLRIERFVIFQFVKCYGQNYADEEPLSASLAYDVLGVAPNCSADELKSAFRNKVKKFHPDVRRNGDSSDKMICRVIQAYEILSNFTKSEIIERLMFSCHIHCLSSAENAWIHFISQNVKHLISLLMRPCVLEKEYFAVTADQCRHGNAIKRAQQCSEALFFIFQTEYLVVSCPFSCVKKAPQAFTFSSLTGTARATSQGHGEEYRELAVGQCPRNCIHYVTPSQRIILEELLGSISRFALFANCKSPF
ncbi:hypothetical protein K7X08_009400 [Anisodus acutangulus]|uniref:J domain-containing protein n=1 Tax=Anisodus acutangulus TaxID=402998 RepID=A0A9Q1N596_9SOLA|nr:hypothetical protein K7X08_009400 [Anisodus acutangulus]